MSVQNKFELNFLGAVQTVTGSKTMLSHNGHKILVDCGLYQGTKEIRRLNWEKFPYSAELEAILLTHAHIDHSGYLPKLATDGFNKPVYCTFATRDLCEIMLMDAAYLQEEDARYAQETKHSRHSEPRPLYTQSDAKAALKLFKPVEYNEWHELSRTMSFRFLRAGHILGSSLIQISLQGEHGHELLTFSGDLGNGRSHVIRPPVSVLESDYLVLESTYGDRVQPHTDHFAILEGIINKVIARHGTLVIPAFTVGRTQELLHIINRLESQGRIPKVPVYVDSPMALDATEIYLNHPEELQHQDNGGTVQKVLASHFFRPVQSADDSMMLCMSEEPKIVISAAGMLTGGRILHHLKARLPDPKNAVLFVGYQAEGTKGLLLKNGLTTIRIHHQNVDVEAEIISIESLSAHADSNDLIAWLRNIQKPPKHIFLNHGEKNASHSLAYRIKNELDFKVEVPEPGDVFVCQNGKIEKITHRTGLSRS